MRGFLFSVSFFGLAVLAFNPYLVLKIQDNFSLPNGYIPLIAAGEPDPAKTRLPDTSQPNSENLPRLAGYERIARHDTWIGPTPCGAEIFDVPESLPGVGPKEVGPLLTDPIAASASVDIVNQPTFLYKSEGGITLKLVKPIVEYYEVKGRRYRDAENDIFNRQPLKTLRQANANFSYGEGQPPDVDNHGGNSRVTVVADILSPTSLSYTASGWLKRYQLVPDKTVMTSAYLVTLPFWSGYETASAADQTKWDDFLCNASHHELGHLRIRLDILAETLDGYAALPTAKSSKEIAELTLNYRAEVEARIQTRQDAYHVYNGGGVRRGMRELPYADLPFPWLESTALQN